VKLLLQDFLSLLYPRPCLVCGQALLRQEAFLCLTCTLNLPKRSQSIQTNTLLKKFAFQPKVKDSHAFLEYVKGGIAQKLIYKLKYEGHQELGVKLGGLFAEQLVGYLSGDVIIPMPLHTKRLRQRGYNQSERIAHGMSAVLGIPVKNDWVSRVRSTSTQTRKTKADRWINMQEVFEIQNPKHLKDQEVLVVDDVITTGASMGGLCDCIAASNPKSITVLTLAAAQ